MRRAQKINYTSFRLALYPGLLGFWPAGADGFLTFLSICDTRILEKEFLNNGVTR